MGQRTAGADEEFEGIVEARRVAAAFDDHRLEVADRSAEILVGKQSLTGAHPIHVAAQGVDFAVVGGHAERMGQIPGREGVGRIALMDQGQGRHTALVGEVGEVLAEGRRQEHALVDDRFGGQRADVKGVAASEGLGPHGVFSALAREQQQQLETLGYRRIGRVADEDLLDQRLVALGDLAESGVVGGHVAPTEHREAVVDDRLFDGGAAGCAGRFVTGHEHQARAVFAAHRQGEAAHCAIQLVRNLDEDAGAIAVARISADRTAMVQVAQDADPARHRRMGLHALDRGNETDAAGIVLVSWIIEALGEGLTIGGGGGRGVHVGSRFWIQRANCSA